MQLATSSLARQSPDLEDLIEKARSYIHAAKVPATQEGKAPLLTSDIRRIVASCPETLSGLRDRALVPCRLRQRLPAL